MSAMIKTEQLTKEEFADAISYISYISSNALEDYRVVYDIRSYFADSIPEYADVIDNVVYEDEMKLVSYPGVDPIDLPHTHVKMDNEFITFSGDGCDEIKIVLDKVINFVCTIGMSFEVPTPECTYRIYVDGKRVNHIIDYWYRIKALKERSYEGKN
jgi:hypothetical protein